MSFLVAITRLAEAAQSDEGRGAEAAALAPLVGMGAYELRVMLGGGAPLVIANTPDAQLARDLVATLRGRGHGAVACDGDAVTRGEDMFSPRGFAFEEHALVSEGPAGEPASFAWGDVLALVVATHVRSEATTVETSKKSFSLGRAAMSGGLLLNKTTKKTEHRTHEEREPVLYMLHRQGQAHWLLAESRLRYAGLGPRRGPAAHDNFKTLLEMLRRQLPGALYDDRLLTQKRAAGSLQMLGASKARTLARSNAGETDLAAHLIAVAHVQRQL
jgi:hypothetical protein